MATIQKTLVTGSGSDSKTIRPTSPTTKFRVFAFLRIVSQFWSRRRPKTTRTMNMTFTSPTPRSTARQPILTANCLTILTCRQATNRRRYRIGVIQERFGIASKDLDTKIHSKENVHNNAYVLSKQFHIIEGI